MIYHDPTKADFRRPYGAAEISKEIFLCCLSDRDTVTLLLHSDSESRALPMARDGERFSVSFPAEDEPGLLWYAFAAGEERTREWQITEYAPSPVPEWYKNAVVYQIFPDSFARDRGWLFREPDKRRGSCRFTLPEWDSPAFYPKDERGAVCAWPFHGGTLRGIEEKLPYLESLGITCLYLNPIFAAASSHRYDTADYMSVDPMLGTEADFVSLCAGAEKRGIRILLDGVFNHTGADSIYFDRFGNYGTAERYKSWFRFGSQYTHGYECWWDVPDLPNVEENDPGYREFICGENGVLRHWLRLGASGWRLDVADELPDSFIRDIRTAVRAEKPDAVLLGEVWEDASNKVSYGERRRYFAGDELDSTMHYPFRTLSLDFLTGRIDAQTLADGLEELRQHYPRENYYAALNLIGSHDRERALTVLGGDKKKLRCLQAMQFVLPGVPCLYYGDEAGMEGGSDPYNRAPYPWGNEDAELQAHFRFLTRLYREHPVLRSGEAAFSAEGEDVFLCERRDEREALRFRLDRKNAEWTLR